MSARRRALVAVIVAIFAALLMYFLCAPNDHHAVVVERRAHAEPVPHLTKPGTSLHGGTEAPILASPYAPGHAAVAQTLGFVSVHCWAGHDFDDQPLVGRFHPKVTDGWYSDVKTVLEGQEYVYRRGDSGGMGTEVFVVSWSVEGPGDVASCEVHDLTFATVDVFVVDATGLPMSDLSVAGCGASDRTDDSGHAFLERAHAGMACGIKAYDPRTAYEDRGIPPFTIAYSRSDACVGVGAVEPLVPDEVRSVDLVYACDGSRPARRTSTAEDVRVYLPEVGSEEELERLYDIAGEDLGEAGNTLVEDLITDLERGMAMHLTMKALVALGDHVGATVEDARLLWEQLLGLQRQQASEGSR